MALNASGPISLAGSTTGQSIAVELGQSATGTIALNDSNVRALAGVASGPISMPTDFWGKSSYYGLQRSLRFRSSASAYLNRTPASAATSRRIMTYSAWVKLGILGTQRLLYEGYTSVSDLEYFYFNSSDQLEWGAQVNGGTSYGVRTPAVFRDPSALYHVVIAIDTTQATNTNRIKIYVNGVEQTGLTTFYSGFPAQNTDLEWNNQSSTQVIGWGGHTGYYDGYMAEINMVDGQALTPSSFGQTSTTTGVWIPKKYTGTYGTNGFYLPFTNTTSTSTLGNDFSGNSNTWTVNNISLTSGSTYDSMNDVPTLTSATTANYAVLNPLAKAFSNGGSGTTSNGNLTITYSATNWYGHKSTIAVSSGKWYYEVTNTTGTNFVMCGISLVTVAAETNAGVYRYRSTGEKINTSYTSYGATWSTAGDICGIAFDLDAGTITFYKNGVSQGTAFTGIPAGEYAAEVIVESGPTTANVNFGQQPFAYTPPTGFVALNTFNLPTPTIGATASTTANKYFDATTYTGDGSQTASFTNSGSMQPDLVWSKIRSGTTQGIGVFDSVRGTTGQALDTSATTTEGTWVGSNASDYGYVSAFNSNGFSVNDGAIATTGGYVNFSGRTYVAWQWRASNATAVTNTAGSITSTVSANTTAGFSIVSWVHSSTTSTIGHGLGVAPSMIILKSRTTAYNWDVYTASTGNTVRLILNSTDATTSGFWNNTSPTSTVFTYAGSGASNGDNMIAYCFAQVAGYSAFGSYTGNGSTDGTFVYTGFRPRFIMIKRSNAADSWIIHDTARDIYNGYSVQLYPNSSSAEGGPYSPPIIDELSNGFKCRSSASGTNGSGDTFIYMAFAEVPYKFSNAR